MVGWIVWVTGPPGSGKSTICKSLIRLLPKHGLSAQILSSDQLRKVMTPKPAYSEKERKMLYSILAFSAFKLAEYGINVIIDAAGNRRAYREEVQRLHSRFMEVYVDCPLAIRLKREANRKKRFGAPKGIYAKARTGLSATVPGFGIPYEKPKNPAVTVNSFEQTPNEGAEKILAVLLRKIDNWLRG